MAGEATEGLAIAWILLAADGVIGHGMVTLLFLVAAQAELLDLAPWEPFRFAAVGGMTDGAFSLENGLVLGLGLGSFLPQLFVAFEAKVVRIAGQQGRPRSGVGRVADHALPRHHRGMGEGHLRRGCDLVVAHETEIRKRCV